MKKMIFLFVATSLYFSAHTQEELNKPESTIRELSNDFEVMRDSTSENGVYRTIDYTNESASDADNHNNGVWVYLLHNDDCYATIFFLKMMLLIQQCRTISI